MHANERQTSDRYFDVGIVLSVASQSRPGYGDAHASVSSIFTKSGVRITVQPALARLCRSDHRVLASVRVFAGMSIGRAIAAQRHPARLTCAQVHPGRADLHTFLTFAALRLFN